MKRILLILIFQNFAAAAVRSQSFTVDDLVTLSSLPSKNIDRFMSKNGFALFKRKVSGDTIEATFMPKLKSRKVIVTPEKSVDIGLLGDLKYFTLHTSLAKDYLDGQKSLIKSGFFYNDKKDIAREPSMLFQKGNITVQGNTEMREGVPQYTFLVKVKQIPAAITYAEELLQFDSHEFLTSFFGPQNVKKDMYYLSEKELRKCSVLYSGTKHQAVFVWGDEDNLNNLAYILVSNVLPTAGAEKNNRLTGNNEWRFQNGIHAGMPIKELLRINEMDFDIYGTESELAFMARPEDTGKIDFKKTAIMFSCSDCDDNKLFDQQVVSALDIAKKNLPMYVYDVIIYPSAR